MNVLTSISPVGRETLHDRVYSELRKTLILGGFDVGQVLRIQDLSEAMATSTMPVRAALTRLVSERALEALPNRSVRVPLVTRDRLGDLARARALVEGELVSLALDRLADADLSRLSELTKESEAAFLEADDARRVRRTSEINHEFHFTIYRCAGSQVLIPIVESLWLQSGPYVHVAARLYDKGDYDTTAVLSATLFHWELLDAIKRRDREAAVHALTQDISQSFNLIREWLDANGATEADLAQTR